MATGRRIMPLLAAFSAAAVMSLSAVPVFAAEQGRGGGATVEEFVCFFPNPDDRTQLGTGRAITTPSGNIQVICTGKPFAP